MSELWYYLEDGQQLGPVAFDDLKQVVSKKANAETILVWTNSFRDWKRAADVKGLAAVVRRPPPIAKQSTIPSTALHLQTKRIARAALIGLLVSIVVAAINIAASGLEPWELDEYQITNPEVIAHWIGRLGFIPLICVIVATVRSFRQYGLGASALNAIAGILGVSFIIGIGVMASAYAKSSFRSDSDLSFTSDSERTYYVTKMKEGCFKSQRSNVVNREASDELLQKYCGCNANLFVSAMTRADVKYYSQHNTFSQEMISRFQASAEKCKPT
jgi:hypothetical protein